MLYTEFQGEKLSMLGFGAMRLPTLENGSIDEKQVDEMVKCALEGGVNYFDTAYPYMAACPRSCSAGRSAPIRARRTPSRASIPATRSAKATIPRQFLRNS